MTNFYCKWCGNKYSSVSTLTSLSCSKNPDGKKYELHESSEKSHNTCKCSENKYSSLSTLTISNKSYISK